MGAVGLGQSGRNYLGFNLEFPGLGLEQTVHAEQAVVALAHAQGERRLLSLLTSAPPCGFCRQFLRELQSQPWPKVGELALEEWLPQSFGPEDLGIHHGLLEQALPPLAEAQAEGAARRSWSPYSKTLAGVVIHCTENQSFCGSYLENAAFNPSLGPLQYALVQVRSAGLQWEQIKSIEFWEQSQQVSLWPATEALAASLPGRPQLSRLDKLSG